MCIAAMFNHVFIFFTTAQMYDLSYILLYCLGLPLIRISDTIDSKFSVLLIQRIYYGFMLHALFNLKQSKRGLVLKQPINWTKKILKISALVYKIWSTSKYARWLELWNTRSVFTSANNFFLAFLYIAFVVFSKLVSIAHE